MAVGINAAALTLRSALNQQLHETAPFFVLFGAVVVSAWAGGTGPGILSLVLCAVLGTVYFVPHNGRLWPLTTTNLLQLVLFLACGTLVKGTWQVLSPYARVHRPFVYNVVYKRA